MTYSLNEVEATAKRAARGAGYPWGLAEEAAKATRWLCAHGLDGPSALAELLERGLCQSPADHIPEDLNGIWTCDGTLCPLATGALLSDSASRLGTTAIVMKRVAVPLLLLPFAANAARALNACVTVTLDGGDTVTDGTRLTLAETIPDRADHVTIRLAGTLPETTPRATRAAPEPTGWAILNRFAQRTYAPATEESRLLGAGAGLSDND